jgi:hypothetical protein
MIPPLLQSSSRSLPPFNRSIGVLRPAAKATVKIVTERLETIVIAAIAMATIAAHATATRKAAPARIEVRRMDATLAVLVSKAAAHVPARRADRQCAARAMTTMMMMTTAALARAICGAVDSGRGRGVPAVCPASGRHHSAAGRKGLVGCPDLAASPCSAAGLACSQATSMTGFGVWSAA